MLDDASKEFLSLIEDNGLFAQVLTLWLLSTRGDRTPTKTKFHRLVKIFRLPLNNGFMSFLKGF